jgi:hypothetical protein
MFEYSCMVVRHGERRTEPDRAHGVSTVRHAGQRDAVPAALWNRSDSLRPADLAVLFHGAVLT